MAKEYNTQAQKAASVAGCLNDLVWRNKYEDLLSMEACAAAKINK